ncbi:MAG: hypothetical protein LBF91_07760, partial [Azoarcus sp.]|nr:hypothetical protein [Azoarcus sp.]
MSTSSFQSIRFCVLFFVLPKAQSPKPKAQSPKPKDFRPRALGGVISLTMTYFHERGAHYHRRGPVSR